MDSLKRPAPRPRNSRLRCLLSEAVGLRPLRDWREALAEFAADIISRQMAEGSRQLRREAALNNTAERIGGGVIDDAPPPILSAALSSS